MRARSGRAEAPAVRCSGIGAPGFPPGVAGIGFFTGREGEFGIRLASSSIAPRCRNSVVAMALSAPWLLRGAAGFLFHLTRRMTDNAPGQLDRPVLVRRHTNLIPDFATS